MEIGRLESVIEKAIIDMYRVSETILPDDVVNALKDAYEKETNQVAKSILKAILQNINASKKYSVPMCQDTGTPTFYVTVGEDFPIKSNLKNIIYSATKKATKEIPLRPNTVDPIIGKNPGDNTGVNIPYITWEISKGDTLEITLLPKGGGSENTFQLRIISPGLGLKGVKRAVLQAIYEAGGKPCPPIIVGVGIGGGANIALNLAKKALLRPINLRHKKPDVARLEEELYNLLNQLKIGPMGLGGDVTVLGVNVEYAYRHPASLPIGIGTQCWAARRATVRIYSDGKIEFLSHNIEV